MGSSFHEDQDVRWVDRCVTWAGSHTDEAIHSISDELVFQFHRARERSRMTRIPDRGVRVHRGEEPFQHPDIIGVRSRCGMEGLCRCVPRSMDQMVHGIEHMVEPRIQCPEKQW